MVVLLSPKKPPVLLQSNKVKLPRARAAVTQLRLYQLFVQRLLLKQKEPPAPKGALACSLFMYYNTRNIMHIVPTFDII